MEIKYYEINETQARQARQMWSFTDYVHGSETAAYKEKVENAYKLADEVPEHAKEKALYFADMYARKLAEHINKGFRIELMCPSVMISGAGNFPIRKKEKQNTARDNHFKEYEKIQYYLTKITWLKNAKEIIKSEEPAKETEYEAFKAIENTDIDRLQLIFDGKPSDEIRTVLKSNGYKWSPNNGAWQRQLTDNARASVKRVLKAIAECN